MNKCLKTFSILFVGILFLFFSSQPSYAATINSFSDTITTSRPSASAPLGADQAANATQATIFDNGSIFLASDAAHLRPSTGETLNSVTVASMSAANTPTSGKRIVYFTNAAANTHHEGDPLIAPITAMHTISFINPSAVPSGGKIVITFPGIGDSSASPSASTFAFNGITSSQIRTNNASTCSWTISAPSITCTTDANISAGTTITFLIGCASSSGATCTTQAPRLINPTKSAASGTSDSAITAGWTVTVSTQDGGSIDIDTGKTKIATFESVQVHTTVDPTLTVTIAGVANSVSVCGDTTNTGVASTATEVDLGVVSSVTRAVAAQTFTISTNASSGYTMTATSSGHLINSASGRYIVDAQGDPTAANTPNAAAIAAGTEGFGIHPCGTNYYAANPPAFGTGGGSSNKFANPSPIYAYTLAQSTTPVSENAITIEYAVAVSGTTPSGTYQNVLTYVITPTF